MKTIFRSLLQITGVLMLSVPLLAHHGSASFDTEKELTLKGTVTEWLWANPHCFLKIDVKDESGTVRNWNLEMGNPTDMSVRGFGRRTFKPGDEVTVTLHQCRGNLEGNWAAEGGYDPVADVLFNRIEVDGYFLEYDTSRAGGFEPLRFLPKGAKRVVLGLVSSKKPQLEAEELLMQRIEAAAKFAPLDQLALSPQCGFASSIKGNPLGQAEQEAKLRRIVEVANKVWGTA